MEKILLVLWPLFALIAFGFIARRRNFFEAGFWYGTEKLNYYLLFPALLINSLANAPLDNPQLPQLALAILTILLGGSLILWIGKALFKWQAARFGAYVQGALRFNTYLGLAIVADLFGQPGIAIAAVILAVLVPSGNIISVLALTSGKKVSLWQMLLPIIKNPLIIACFLGVLINISPFGLPFGSEQLFKLLAAASLPLGLICIGAALQTSTLKVELKPLILNSFGRLAIMPIVALLIGRGFELPPMESVLLIIFFAIPTAPNAYILSKQLNGDSELMAGIITLQTILAIFTLPVILTYLI
nr:AEC family transporter [uncultured Moellerella sp.]